MKKSVLLSDLGLLYASAIWGTTFFIVKDSLDSVSPVALIAFRFLVAAAGMAVWIVFSKRHFFRNFGQGFVLGAVLWALYLPQTVGLLFTSAANSGFITGLFVAFLPPLYYLFFRQIPPIQRQIAVAIALAGLWLLTGGMVDINIGDGVTLIGAFFYALHILCADRYVKKGSDPIALSFQQFFTVGVLSLLTLVVLGEDAVVSSGHAWLVILFLAFLPTLSAFVIQLYAQRVSGPVKVGLIFAMEPLFAALFAWTLGGEAFVLSRAFGGLLIVFAIILSELPIKKSRQATNVDENAG